MHHCVRRQQKKLRARNIGKIVNLPYTAKVYKIKILPYGTGNLQLSGAKPTSTNEECGKLLQASSVRSKTTFDFSRKL